ncbi:hypoxanthine phosphoribosyltransferase [Stackebrandtia nassauensis]|uniref:Hypoxanthine phosphoribosyltransferase n=1 Tax=Stackebrandtia nassauensis (strain DSM 44728 / CIP 108903 / NRRL B-16338 / NBRC 102104 / LLR-40K-21) TaxID=446470 RepID=D3Q841_STANL|nr:hypoxanthine phosphoribosyltransferase [Stackebrandtia nassauensis]ADD40546.1 hypoxanthine phosphoribosyltransferase [Stackebrandtia nassauensis DSM 44728]
MTPSAEHPGAPAAWYENDIDRVLVSETEIREKTAALAKQIDADYANTDGLLLVGLFKGAVMFMADLARALTIPVEMEFMALSSYGQRVTSSGVVRVLKDLDTDIKDRDVLVVEDVVDSGLTLSWLLKYLPSRGPRSVEMVSMLRKPKALETGINVKYVGFDVPDEFVVGYGLDYSERYRELPFVGVLKPSVYQSS